MINKKGETALLIVSIIAIVAIVALVVGMNIQKNTTGSAVTSPGQGGGKTENTPCARGCTETCINGASLPASNVDELSVDDCMTQCLQARCNQNVRGGLCDASSADGCCNIFSEGQDPDCCFNIYKDYGSAEQWWAACDATTDMCDCSRMNRALWVCDRCASGMTEECLMCYQAIKGTGCTNVCAEA